MRPLYFFILVFSCTTIISCSSHKKVKSTDTAVIKDTTTPIPDEIVKPDGTEITDSSKFREALDKYQFEIKSAELKGTMFLDNNAEQYSFSFNIRVLKDSVVWIQIKKLSLEGIRLLATRDSITIIDRLKRSVIHKSWAEMQKDFKIPLDLRNLTDMVLGQPIRMTNIDRITLENNDLNWVQTSFGSQYNQEISIDQETEILKNIVIHDIKENNTVNIKQNNYKNLFERNLFSYLRDIELFSNKEKLLYVNLEIDEATFNVPLSTPFEIPSNYKQNE